MAETKIFYDKVKNVLKDYPNTTIIAATKYANIEQMKELLKVDINHFGENRVDSLLEKKKILVNNFIIWHFIGTLQTRKVKQVINEIDYLHSLDNLKLAKEINKYRKEKLKVFIQVNVTKEESKSGIDPLELDKFYQEIIKLEKIEVVGLMTMAENTQDSRRLEETFQKLNQLRKENQSKYFYLSMGMSNDYKIALKHGATHIRLGRILFGSD